MRPDFKKGDYTFIFQSRGTSFIFEYLVFKYYLGPEWETLNIFNRDDKRVFFTNKTVADLQAEGMRRTPEEIQVVVMKLRAGIAAAKKEISRLQAKQTIADSDFLQYFEHLKFLTHYRYFEFSYWDKVFEISKTDAVAAQKVALVQENKNLVREELDIIFFGEGSYLETLIRKASHQFGVPVAQLNWYTTNELLGLFEGIVVSVEILKSREKCIYHTLNGNLDFFTGEDAQAVFKEFEDTAVSLVEINGKTAHSTGITIKAKVRILSRDYGDNAATKANIAAMQQGEVLVAESTDPELIPAFRKASAVLTDVGGLLSHAAITSREMNLPCIVGTGNASKVLKTGDLVEVDAQKGIVRILERV